ncbi:hypothetical protein R3W88_027234 [Solanum pinnatisectum]|uniref:Uncharacterized protein n=1 Tax=Solanum pinnatisectum TaxID=50273 RepID=A0AAV9LHZ0_9SOLN|nr:hypothetical protein R3W88_027234 [Solanum pinnatisectum]
MAYSLVSYSDDESSFDSPAYSSFSASPIASSQGGGGLSTDTSLTNPLPDFPQKSPVLIHPSCPLPAYASGNPFTPSPSPPHSEPPIPPHSISPPPSLIESPIPTITTSPPPTNPNDPYLDDIPLNQLHPKIPLRLCKYIAVKRTHIRILFTRSASQAQLQEATESSSVATSSVNGVELVFDSVRLGEIFHIPSVGLSEYVWTKDVNCMLTTKHEASFRDMGIAHSLENKDPIDWPSLMIKHMNRVIDPKPDFDVPLGEGRALVSCDMITRSTLATCQLCDEALCELRTLVISASYDYFAPAYDVFVLPWLKMDNIPRLILTCVMLSIGVVHKDSEF